MAKFSLEFNDVGDDTPQEVALHNLLSVDSTHQLQWIIAASEGWLRAHPHKNYEDLMILMRNLGLDTWLVAAPVNQEHTSMGFVLKNENDPNRVCKWEVRYASGRHPYGFNEMTSIVGTAEENALRMSSAGRLHGGMDEFLASRERSDMTMNPETTQDYARAVSNNAFKMDVEFFIDRVPG